MNTLKFSRLAKGDLQVAQRLAPELLGDSSVRSERLVELLSDDRSIVLAAVHQDAPVAYLVAYCFPSLSGERLAYLYDIEVKKTFRRQEIDKRLVEELLTVCRSTGVESIWVGSSLTNAAACALWSSTGAEREGDQYVEFTYELR
jgi:ribosomal protein S18 acetylase RimI-like enzyme